MAESGSVNVCRTRAVDQGVVVEVGGDIDLTRSPTFRKELLALLETSAARVVVDLSGVPFMDSSGVATLVEALRVQKSRGQKLVLCGLQPRVRSMFQIARLDGLFPITDSAQNALSA